MSEPKDIWYADDGRPMCRHGGQSHSLNVLCPEWQLTDPQVLTITGFPPYDGQWVRRLELPTEPTWGIVVNKVRLPKDGIRCLWNYLYLGLWTADGKRIGSRSGHLFPIGEVAAFIPLTQEQVRRIQPHDDMNELTHDD